MLHEDGLPGTGGRYEPPGRRTGRDQHHVISGAGCDVLILWYYLLECGVRNLIQIQERRNGFDDGARRFPTGRGTPVDEPRLVMALSETPLPRFTALMLSGVGSGG